MPLFIYICSLDLIMLRKINIICLVLGLAVFAGCNDDVFVKEQDVLASSVESYEFPDTGDTLNISLNKDDWYIKGVVYTDEDGLHDKGYVKEDGNIRKPVPMALQGLGEVWIERRMNGFKVVRDKADGLTVIMDPNFNDHGCGLHIFLATETQLLELIFTQKPSEGLVIDRVEWDENLKAVGTIMVTKNDPTVAKRNIYIQGGMHKGEYVVTRQDLMKLLNADSIELPIPDPYPLDKTLTFSGIHMTLLPDVNSYEIDVWPDSESIMLPERVEYLRYRTDFHIYVKHVRDDSISLCFTGSFTNETPKLR